MFSEKCRMVVMNKTKQILQILSPVGIALIVYMLLRSTDPATIGPGGILLVFFLLYLLCLSLLYAVIRYGYRAATWLSSVVARRDKHSLRKRTARIDSKKAYYVASVLSFVPVALLAIHSFSGLRWTDLALVILFAGIATFYVLRRQSTV